MEVDIVISSCHFSWFRLTQMVFFMSFREQTVSSSCCSCMEVSVIFAILISVSFEIFLIILFRTSSGVFSFWVILCSSLFIVLSAMWSLVALRESTKYCFGFVKINGIFLLIIVFISMDQKLQAEFSSF